MVRKRNYESARIQVITLTQTYLPYVLCINFLSLSSSLDLS